MVADPWGLYVYVYVVISMLWHQSCWNSKLVHFGLRTFKYEHHDYVESRIQKDTDLYTAYEKV